MGVAKDKRSLPHIEFETSDAFTVEAPDSFSGGGGSNSGALLAMACILGGMLALLLWINSQAESTATPEEQDVRETQDDTPLEEISVEEDADIVELSLEPQAFPIALEGVVAFDGRLVGVQELPGVRNGAEPALLTSTNGVDWVELNTEAFNSSSPNVRNLKWSDLRVIGNELALSAADFDSSFDTYTSTDAVTWRTVPDVVRSPNGDRVFAPFTATNERISGLYFDESATVTCADETVVEMGSHLRLISIDRSSSEISSIADDLRLPLSDPAQMIPAIELPDGGIGGVWRNDAPDADGQPCAGEPGSDDYDDVFYVVEPDGTSRFFPLPGELAADDLEASAPAFLGAVEVGSGLVPLFSSGNALWTVDFVSGVFRQLWSNQSTDIASFVIADSNDRVYVVADGGLHVFDFITGPGGVGFVIVGESGAIASPISSDVEGTAFTSAELIFADSNRVIVNAADSTWLVELPVQLASCERQYDLAREGFGVVDDYCVRQPTEFVAAGDTAISQPLELGLLDAQVFGDEIVGLAGELDSAEPPVYTTEPRLYRSDDTTEWEPIETTVSWDDGPQPLWWIGIEQRSDELVAFAFAPGSGGNRVMALSSSDGRDWTFTDDYGQGQSDLLLFSYTARSLLFIDSVSSILPEADGDQGSATLCRNALSEEGSGARYSVAVRTENGESVDPFDGSFSFAWSVPTVLADGRVAVLDAGVSSELADACAEVLGADVFQSTFRIGDVTTGASQAWTLPADFEPVPAATTFLGEGEVDGSSVFLFADAETLWILDPETSVWDSVPVPFLESAGEQIAVSTSGRRIYAIVDNSFLIGDLIRSGDGVDLVETREAFAMSDQLTQSFGELAFVFASDDRVVVNTETGRSWRVTPISREEALG